MKLNRLFNSLALSSLCFFCILEQSLLGQENLGNVKTYTNIATTLIGQVTIDGEAAGVGDIVGIYVGEELRGKNEVIVNGWDSLVECAGSRCRGR